MSPRIDNPGTPKRIRHAAIVRVLTEHRITKQSQIVERLAAMGIRSTQSQVCNDLRTLRVTTERDAADGLFVYRHGATAEPTRIENAQPPGGPSEPEPFDDPTDDAGAHVEDAQAPEDERSAETGSEHRDDDDARESALVSTTAEFRVRVRIACADCGSTRLGPVVTMRE